MQKLYKVIPTSELSLYSQHGWSQSLRHGSLKPDTMWVELSYNNGQSYTDHFVIERKTPHLILLGKIVRPFSRVEGRGLSSSLDLEYMGSAEFEYGAIPRSLSRIYHQRFAYQKHRIDEVFIQQQDCKYVCRLFTHFKGDDLAAYRAFLVELQAGKHENHLKEFSQFDFKEGMPKRNDFWWDIENDCMWSYDKQYMGRLASHLDVTFDLRSQNAD